MADWNNFYIQRMGTDSQGNPWSVYESVARWGVFCKDMPFIIAEKAKEPAKRSWNDEHGDDEYVSSDGLYMEAYNMKVEFGCKLIPTGSRGATTYGTAVDDVRVKVKSFIDYLRTSGMVKVYSSYTGIGRQNVRLVGVDDDASWKKRSEWRVVNNVRTKVVAEQWLIFKVEFKVNDPITDWVPSLQS